MQANWQKFYFKWIRFVNFVTIPGAKRPNCFSKKYNTDPALTVEEKQMLVASLVLTQKRVVWWLKYEIVK